MEATTTTALRQSIEAIKDYDFSGQWKTNIYLDPEAKNIYPFTNTNCIPGTAYHNIDQFILTVSPSAIAASVYDYLIEIEEELQAIIEEYQGSEWNGNNHVGRWSEEGMNLKAALSMNHHPEIASYWDAGDWFEPVTGELKTAWEEGKTAEEIIDEQGCGDEINGMCDRSEAIEWLNRKINEWQAEQDDQDEDEEQIQ